MASSSFLHTIGARARRGLSYTRALARNRYFWGGLGALAVVALVLYVFINAVLMPFYTRHDVVVEVPDVENLPYAEAIQVLARADLEAERVIERFDPERPRDVIVAQSPEPGDPVKPGRRIYLTVNTGEVPTVIIPALEQLPLREAENRLKSLGLTVSAARPDTMPSPYAKTITRVEPAPGTTVPRGSSVALWYSTGPGERYVRVPDVTEMPVEQARTILLEQKLRSVVLGDLAGFQGEGEALVLRQSPEAGTQMREGSEIRLFIEEE